MGKYGVYTIAILLAVASVTVGRPTKVTDKGEFRSARLEVEMLRPNRPCHARRLEVRTDIAEFGDIMDDPHYVPDCDEEGILWKAAQCDHHDVGRCFCVHEEDGSIMNHTITLRLNKEALKCGRRTEFNSHTDHMCFHMKDEFAHMQKEFGLQGHSPLPYYPECTKTGKFEAMQRDGSSNFFCVDTETGAIIPDTMTTATSLPPLSAYICEEYDRVWQEFKAWNATEEKSLEKTVTKESCKKGFDFTECGCPKICTSESQANEETECACKPACLCPDGKWELEGECVSLEECHEANPQSNVLFPRKLEALTAGKFNKWQQYQMMNPNKILETFNTNSGPMEEPIPGASVAYDANPRAVSFFHEGAPSSEEVQEQNETSEENESQGSYRGGEPIPVEGQEIPILRLVLMNKGYTPEQIAEIIETGTTSRPWTVPPEEVEPTEFNPSAESFDEESSNEEEEQETEEDSEEAEVPIYETVDYYGENATTEEYENQETTAANEEFDEFSEYEQTTAAPEEEEERYTHENGTEEEEDTVVREEEEEGYMNENVSEEESREYQPYQPEIPEENEPELEPEQPIDASLPPEEISVPTESPDNWIENPLDEDNTQGTNPDEEEPNNPESNDEVLNHQKKLTSVPSAPNDEQQEHSSTPPCEESENEQETAEPTTTATEAKGLINRVLSENKVFANFSRESLPIKKSTMC